MSQKQFIFNAVVPSFQAFNKQIEDIQNLKVLVKFSKIELIVPGSRINVPEIQEAFGVEFSVDPKTLQNSLSTYGISVAVVYNNELLGNGHITIPQIVVNSLRDGPVDLLRSESLSFKRHGILEGRLEVLYHLITKCDSSPKLPACVDQSINPQDIMFLIADSQRYSNPCAVCCDVIESEKNDDGLKLDLQRYASFNAAGFRTADSFKHSTFGNTICNELKRMSQDCTHTIESILKKPGMSSSPKLLNHRSKESKRSPSELSYKRENIELPLIKNIRYCPVCLNNLSWLPRFATCPKCGAKPEPVVMKPDKRKLSVEEILKEYLIKPSPNPVGDSAEANDKITGDNSNMGQRAISRCTCKDRKLCANCRIRKKIADVLPPTDKLVSKENSQLSKAASDTSQKGCELDKTPDSRPFLARVFSDLREIYDGKRSNPRQKNDQKCFVNRVSTKSQQIHDESSKYDQQTSERQESSKHAIANQEPSAKVIKEKKRIGHKSCANKLRFVSRRHGWAWSSSREALKYGWRPGAVRKPIKKLMDFFLKKPSIQSDIHDLKMCNCKAVNKRPPVLNVCKRNGEILITLHGVNSSRGKTKPIAFKIGKSELAIALREIKRKLKDMGFRKCTCHKSIMLCVCRNNMEKMHLETALSKECHRRGMQNCVDQLVLTDTSDSEVEFDFEITPPAGLAQPTALLKRTTINHGTQTCNPNQNLLGKRPKHINPYWRANDCAAADRYTGTAFGDLNEVVFEDGILGYKGGGPHGPSVAPGGKPKNQLIWGTSPGGPMRGGGSISPDGKLGGVPFPAAKKKSESGGKKQIPVRMTQRYHKAIKDAKLKQEILAREAKRKEFNMMKYLQKAKIIYSNKVGRDGLTNAQRRRKDLFNTIMPPLDTLPRLGRGIDPHTMSYSCYPYGRNFNYYYS